MSKSIVNKKVKKQASSLKKSQGDSHLNEKIQQKAYENYLTRGCAPGYESEDWLKAEEMVAGSNESQNTIVSQMPTDQIMR